MRTYIVLFLLFIGLLIYSSSYFSRKNVRLLNANWLKTIKIINFLSLVICLINVILIIEYNKRFSGYWTINVCMLLGFLTWFLINALINNTFRTRFERFYNWLFILLLFISTPFLLIDVLTSNVGINYEDNYIKIETNGGLMMPPHHDIYQKKGLLEKNIHRSTFRGDETDSLSVTYNIDSTEITFFSIDSIKNSLSLEKKYKIDSIKLVFAKLN
jgi:hypothetical protein